MMHAHNPQSQSTNNNNHWKLVEIVQNNETSFDPEQGAPLQLLKLQGSNPEAQGPLFIVAGFLGAAKNDSKVIQLLQRALQNTVIKTSPIYIFAP